MGHSKRYSFDYAHTNSDAAAAVVVIEQRPKMASCEHPSRGPWRLASPRTPNLVSAE